MNAYVNLYNYVPDEEKHKSLVILEITENLKKIIDDIGSNRVEFSNEITQTTYFPGLGKINNVSGQLALFYKNSEEKLVVNMDLLKSVLKS